ncbi:MAG: Trm112 family protein [Paracoccaceae bacterium]
MTDTSQNEPAGHPAQSFDPRMLEGLVCPVSHAVLTYDPAAQELVSKQARLAFPIRNGIPVMLLTEARSLA